MCNGINEEWVFTHSRSHGCILSLPTPCVSCVHRLVSLSSQWLLILRVGCRGPQVCLCHRPLRLPLSGQRPVTSKTGSGGNRAPCWRHKRWQRSSTLTAAYARAPSLVACFLRGLVRNLGRPRCRRLGQHFPLGCQVDVGGEGLLKVLESKGFIHQAQGMPGGSLPGSRGFVALLQPGCLPYWGGCRGPCRRFRGRRS